MNKKDLIFAARHGHLYDYLADHYYEMTTEQLADIAKTIYFVAQDGMPFGERAIQNKKLAKELKEYL